MLSLSLIGIGTGNPEHLTLQAVRHLNAADLILIPRKGAEKAQLAELRQQICDEVLTTDRPRIREFDLPLRDSSGDYREGVEDWHDRIAAAWIAAIDAGLPGGTGRVAFLVWGDPSLYDSTLRIAARLEGQRAVAVEVIPGITSVQGLCAAHAIPLNEIGAPVHLTTGRQLRDHGWPAAAETVVVMLDGGTAFEGLDPEGIDIWWGAYVGMDQQQILSGPLSQIGGAIREARAAARARHGWIMDIYLLRRRSAA